MPASFVKTKEEEVDWERAKGIVSEQYPGKEDEDRDGYFALVTTVYKSIRKGHGDNHFEKAATESTNTDATSIATESLWKSLERLKDVIESPLYERIVTMEYVRPLDEVIVLTKLGRYVSEGMVKSISDGKVILSVLRGDTFYDSPYDERVFMYSVKANTQESMKELKLRESEEKDQGNDPVDVPMEIYHGNGPAEQYEIIMKVLGIPQRESAVVWKDIMQFGWPNAMKMHQIGPDKEFELKVSLNKGGFAFSDPDVSRVP